MKPWLASVVALALAACASVESRVPQSLDNIAHDYVRLVLEIDAHEPGYVDAYFGPSEWRDEARKNPRARLDLKREADRLKSALGAYRTSDPELAQRAKVLLADISSARFRLDMIDGKRVSFVDEAERLFALRPVLKPLSAYDDALRRIDVLAPGEGTLAERVEAFRSRYAIPEMRVRDVMEAAIVECRRRTLEHIRLPEGENFGMTLVKDKSWGAYNYYQGGNQSKIEVNTDLPVAVGNALVLGCHEGYPGHHVQGIYNERNFREKGWAEYSVAPLYMPASPLNEGGGDFGLELAFPDGERLMFEKAVLYPLAGLDPATADVNDAFRKATDELDGAQLTIAQMYLDKQVSRSEIIGLIQKYQLVPRDVAEQSLEFYDQYRSYVINYSVGEALVRDYVGRVGGADPQARWAAYEHILSTPTLPSDLK
ncbi:MAG: hypothetical protein QM773_20545 [Hyphomonadaceae bacterium]